jgi:hypothetical protein
MLSLSGYPELLDLEGEDTAVLCSMGDCFPIEVALCLGRLESLWFFCIIENCLSCIGVLH